jgi:hypothetical protein
MFIAKFVSKVIGEMGQWREYRARGRQLPASYRTALDALERYLNYYGGTGGDGTALYGDLVGSAGLARGRRSHDTVAGTHGAVPLRAVDQHRRAQRGPPSLDRHGASPVSAGDVARRQVDADLPSNRTVTVTASSVTAQGSSSHRYASTRR